MPSESCRTAFDVSPTGSKAEACEVLNVRVYSGRAGPSAGAPSEWLEDDAAVAAARGADGSLPTVSIGAPSCASSAPIFHWDAGALLLLSKTGPLPLTPPWLLLLTGEGRYTLRSVLYRLPAMPNRPQAGAGAAPPNRPPAGALAPKRPPAPGAPNAAAAGARAGRGPKTPGPAPPKGLPAAGGPRPPKAGAGAPAAPPRPRRLPPPPPPPKLPDAAAGACAAPKRPPPGAGVGAAPKRPPPVVGGPAPNSQLIVLKQLAARAKTI